jgi:hypothetical protein
MLGIATVDVSDVTYCLKCLNTVFDYFRVHQVDERGPFFARGFYNFPAAIDFVWPLILKAIVTAISNGRTFENDRQFSFPLLLRRKLLSTRQVPFRPIHPFGHNRSFLLSLFGWARSATV